MLRNEDYEQSLSQFNNLLKDITDETDDDDLDDFLSQFGISRSGDDE